MSRKDIERKTLIVERGDYPALGQQGYLGIAWAPNEPRTERTDLCFFRIRRWRPSDGDKRLKYYVEFRKETGMAHGVFTIRPKKEKGFTSRVFVSS